jgi:hypothetical protein
MALRLFRLAGLILILGMVSGCPKALIVKSMDPIMVDLTTAMNKNTDVEMLRKAMPVYLEQMDGFILSAPEENEALLLRAAEANYLYASSYVEDSDTKRASLLYLKARKYTLDELRRYRIFDQAFTMTTPEFYKALYEGLDIKDLPFIYWTAINWAAWISINADKPEAQEDMPKVEAMLKYVLDLDESYREGTAHAWLGTLYACRPKSAGGNPRTAKEQFDKAFILSGNSLFSVHVLYAKHYARQIQDKELFKKTLEKIAASPVGYYPDKAFVNEAAKMRARGLLENIDKFFPPEATQAQ